MTVQGSQLRIAYKNPCRAATTADHGLSGLVAFDDVTPVAGDRILVKENSSGSENGIYLAASGSWTRAEDMDSSTNNQDQITAGLAVYVQEGTANGQKTFTLTTTGTITLDTTVLTFAELGGGAALGDIDEIIYVNKAGNDSNDGRSVDAAKLTLASALTAASAQSPTATNRVEVRILGGATYTENLALPAYVSLNGPEAIVEGYFTSIGTDCRVKLHRLVGTSSTLIPLNSAGERWIEIAETETTTGNHVLVSHASAIGTLKIGTMTQSSSGSVLGGTAGLLRGYVEEISMVGATAAVNMVTTAVARLDIGRIDDDGSGTGINHTGTGTLDLFIRTLDANTTYTVTDGSGVLNLFVGDLIGTAGTITGTANVVEASDTGDVTGPASATDNAIVRFNLTTGKLIQNSVVTIDDTTGHMTFPNAGQVQWGDGNTWITGDGTTSTGDLTLRAADDIFFQVGGSSTFAFTMGSAGTFIMKERSADATAVATFGQLWVRDDSPNVPVFTDDDDDQHNLLSWSPVKRPCKVATTANHGLSGTSDVDGVSISAGDRILVWKQTTAYQNGIYLADASTWSRAGDFDDATKDHIEAGIQVYVQQGDTYARVPFTLVTTGAITLGVTNLTFIAGGALVRSDTVESEIKSTGAFAATYAYTDNLDVIDYDHVDIYVECTNKGTNTSVTIKAQSTGESSPTTWSDLVSDDDIADGVTTPATYEATFDISGLSATFRLHLNFPKRGTTMRFGVKGTAADGAYTVQAVRNVGG
jgi:hypothetical protein